MSRIPSNSFCVLSGSNLAINSRFFLWLVLSQIVVIWHYCILWMPIVSQIYHLTLLVFWTCVCAWASIAAQLSHHTWCGERGCCILHTGLEFLKKVLSKWSDLVQELTHNLSSNMFVTTLRECGMFINCTFGGWCCIFFKVFYELAEGIPLF